MYVVVAATIQKLIILISNRHQNQEEKSQKYLPKRAKSNLTGKIHTHLGLLFDAAFARKIVQSGRERSWDLFLSRSKAGYLRDEFNREMREICLENKSQIARFFLHEPVSRLYRESSVAGFTQAVIQPLELRTSTRNRILICNGFILPRVFVFILSFSTSIPLQTTFRI